MFANRVNDYVNSLPKLISNYKNGKQLVRSAGSVGADYIEANECLGKKDFQMIIKIAKKEAKESILWLRLSKPDESKETEKNYLIQEANELMKILGAILQKTIDKSKT